MWKSTEIQIDSLRIRRRVRLVQYIVGKDDDGKEIEIEISDGAADAVIDAIKEAGK